MLCQAGTATIWVHGGNHVAITPELTITFGSNCCFCGQSAADVSGLIGIAGEPSRICSGCLTLCLESMQEAPDNFSHDVSMESELAAARVRLARSRTMLERAVGDGYAKPERGAERLAAIATTESRLEEILTSYFAKEDAASAPSSPALEPASCSFCSTDMANRRIFEGLKASICEVCVTDAITLLDSALLNLLDAPKA